MPYVDRSPLNYQINTTNPLPIRQETRAPIDNQDGFGDTLLTIWNDVSSEDIYMLVQRSRAQTTSTWVLLGGTPSALSTLTVDAFTPPGTNPVTADGANTITITGGQVTSGTVGANVIRTDSLAANTLTIEVQQAGEAAAQDTTLNGVCHFNSTQFDVTNGFVELAGGGIAIDQITVDASTPPGTNPVLPDGTGNVTMTGGQVATGTVGANVIRINSAAANTLATEIQRTTTAAATDSTINGVSHFDSAAFTVDANGFVQLVGSGTPAVEFLVSSGTSPVVPNGSGQITLTDGNGVGMTGGLNAITFDMVSPFTGSFTFTGTVTAEANAILGTSGSATNLSMIRSAAGQWIDFDDQTDNFGFFNSAGSPEGSIAADIGSLASDTTNGDLYIKTTDTVNTGWDLVGSSSNDILIQQVANVTTSSVATAATMNSGGTPVQTEGAEVITVTITPTNASNILVIEWNADVYANARLGQVVLGALFQDSTANAIAATQMLRNSNIGTNNALGARNGLIHRMVAGTTSATTFKFRVGSDTTFNTTVTINFNGFGGVQQAYLIVSEIKV